MRSLFSLVFFALTAAHNWMISPSRVPFAATVFPCMPARSSLPHIQVARGQRFQMEWATGHDRYVYFVLLRKENATMLERHTEQRVDAYINGGSNLMNSQWAKKHRTPKKDSDTHSLGGTVSSHYQTKICTDNWATTGGTCPLPRPSRFGKEQNCWTYNYPNGVPTTDKYASYTNPTYPWIISAWKYQIEEADPNEGDVAEFEIPTSAGPGDYILHYIWSGYYDCIDVNVLATTTPIPYVYGKPLNGSSSLKANRIDHCIFDSPLQFTTWPRPVIGGAKAAAQGCLTSCIYNYERSGCGGIVTFPVSLLSRNDFGPHWNPSNNIIKTFYEWAWDPIAHFSDGSWNVDEGIPYDVGPNDTPYNFWRQFVRHPSFLEYTGINRAPLTTLRTFQEGSSFSTGGPWTCVQVHPRAPTTTRDKMTVTDDPLDPIFYSTCWEVIEAFEFIGFNLTENGFTGDISYKLTGGKCLTCDDAVAWGDESYAPTWSVAAKCEMCERKPPSSGRGRVPKLSKKQLQAGLDFPTSTAGCATVPSGYANWYAYCVIEYRDIHDYYTSDETKKGYLWPEENHFHWSPELCADYVSTRSECSDLMTYRYRNPAWPAYPDYSWWTGCGCIRQHSCCSGNMISTFASWQSNIDQKMTIWDIPGGSTAVPGPDPTCATGIKNTGNGGATQPAANTYCCKGSCGTYGCTDRTDQGWVSGVGAFCQSYNIPKDRWCSEWGPPCRLA